MLVTFQPVDARYGTALGGVIVINLDHVSKIQIDRAAQGQGITYARLYLAAEQNFETVYIAAGNATDEQREGRIADFLDVVGSGIKPVFSSEKDARDRR